MEVDKNKIVVLKRVADRKKVYGIFNVSVWDLESILIIHLILGIFLFFFGLCCVYYYVTAS